MSYNKSEQSGDVHTRCLSCNWLFCPFRVGVLYTLALLLGLKDGVGPPIWQGGAYSAVG